jgi:hypothetical protein
MLRCLPGLVSMGSSLDRVDLVVRRPTDRLSDSIVS